MDKNLKITLNGARRITGVLRGYDVFLNLVIDEAIEEVVPKGSTAVTERKEIGTVVVRGNSVVLMEALEPISER